MKKIILISSVVVIVLILSLLSLANLNVINLLLHDTNYGSGSSLENFNHSEEEDEVYNPEKSNTTSEATLESLQSGLIGQGGGGGSLNLLWLLQNAKDPDKSSYAYQLLEVYAKLEKGEYNDLPYHISPDAIAGSHYNETKLASFATPSVSGYGKVNSGILGKTVNGKVLTLENAVRSDIVGNVSRGGNVWKDANGDGYPDGPFQIIQGRQSDSYSNKTRLDKKYDLYNFVDAANVVDGKYNTIARAYAESGSTPDARAINMLSALAHNRGGSGVGWSLFGFPYDVSTPARGQASKYLKHHTIESMTPKELEVAAMFPKDLAKWFDLSNIPLEEIAGGNDRSQGVATLLTLANGGFLDIPLQRTSANNIKSLKDSTIKKIFPDQSRATIIDYINSKYVKNPWDVLGMSKSKYDSIYGSGPYANYEAGYSTPGGYYRNTVFYIDPSITSTNYKAGDNTVVVRAIEGISLGYLLDTGIGGTYTIMKIAIEAGIKTLTNGTTVDPTNPASFYQSLDTGTYNPAGAASGNFGKFLDALGLSGKLTETQQAQIEALYKYSGGPYSQSRRGSAYKDGLLYLDCSSFASIGLYLGLGSNSQFVTTADVNNGKWLKSKAKTLSVGGKTYDAKVVQLNKQGQPMKESTVVDRSQMKRDTAWLDNLQTGDMVNGRGANGGHIFTYLGKNRTDKTIVLTQDISKVNAPFSKYNPGEHFTIQAAWYANFTSAGGSGGDNSGKMGLMPLWGDTSGAPYHAMRPVYNLK